MRTILDANAREGVRFDILSNPEFLAEGTAIADLFNPDRVLIGSLQTEQGLEACQALADVYANWIPCVPVPPTWRTCGLFSRHRNWHVSSPAD